MKSLPFRIGSIIATLVLVLSSITPMNAAGGPVAHKESHNFTNYAPQGSNWPADEIEKSRPVSQGEKTGNPKLQSVLGELSLAYEDGGQERALALAQDQDVNYDGTELTLVVETAPGETDDVAMALEALGVKEETRYKNSLQVRAPLEMLVQLADLPSVSFVRLPYYPRSISETGSVASSAERWLGQRPFSAVADEGVAVIGADVWHSAGFTGQGTTIAILDIGFAGYESLLGEELPNSVFTRSFRTDGDITGFSVPHGTAVAEIIHDVAPDAQLLFVNFDTDIEWANAVDFIISQGVSIVSSSIGFVIGPLDGTGFFSDKVTEARNAGIFWAQSSGNYAMEHWMGGFTDLDGNGKLNFRPLSELNPFIAPPNGLIRVFLTWDDWPVSDQDYDLVLYVLQSDGGWLEAARSDNFQTGFQPPFEGIVGRSPSGGTFGVVIVDAGATRNVNFQLFTPDNELQFQVAESSLAIPADSPGAVAVGATRFSTDQLEPFSSRGPTVDGRTKPDIAAPDGVSTATFGQFFGTSASAPHVAGAAALVQSANPFLSPAEIQAFLEERAADLSPPGKDNIFGSGRLDLGPPVDVEVLRGAGPVPSGAPATVE